jgi:hypothetical protein
MSVAGAEVGSNGLGFPRKPATAAVAASYVVVFVVVAFVPKSVAGGSSGLGPSRTPAAAVVVVSFVVVFVALRRAASQARIVALYVDKLRRLMPYPHVTGALYIF